MKATRAHHIQTYWGGAGLSQLSFGATCSALMNKSLVRSRQNTHVIDIKSDPSFALNVLRKISFDKIPKNDTARITGELPVDADFIASISEQGSYLLSQIIHDIDKLKKVDWTVEFDPFWEDQVENHKNLHSEIYKEQSFVAGLLYPKNRIENENEGKIVGFALNYLQSMVECAFRTEAVYSQIFYAKFAMQRGVRDSVEREKILLGCAHAYDNFQKEVISEHAKKAVKELHWHLMGIRHWVWDCPNAKRIYSRILG